MKNGSNMNQSTIIKIMATFMLTFSVSRANSITNENLNIMGLNKIDSQVTWGRAAESLNANFNHINSDMEKMKNASFRNKGYFLTEADMKAAYPTANVGDKAYVGTSESFAIWVYGTNGWKNSGKTGGDESVDLEQYYTKTEVDEIVLTPAKDAAAYAEVAATQATNAATSASESAQSAADAANSAEASKAASEASAKSALAAEEKSKEAAISAFNAKNSASLAVSTAEQAVEIAKDATDTSNDSLETSISNRYGYNVTIHGLKGGIHTIETAVKDVPAKHRMLGQKITFRTENGDWATYHNESLSLDNYTNTDDWVQDVGISSVTGDINITNAPDYEDLTEAADGTIKFADKEYSKESYSGLGRVYLRKNIVDGVNVLTQDMIAKTNTRYIIQYDYDLQGAEITIPEGCVLDFQGGSLSNGNIVGSITKIKEYGNCIFDRIIVSGHWDVPRISTGMFKDVDKLNTLIQVFNLTNENVSNHVTIEEGIHNVEMNALIVNSNTTINLIGNINLVANGSASYYIMRMLNSDNIHIYGSGSIIGDMYDHDYTIEGTHEWGIGIGVLGCNNISIEGITIKDCTGDSVNLGQISPMYTNDKDLYGKPCTNITINRCSFIGSRRQGITLIMGSNILIENCSFDNIYGYHTENIPNGPGSAIDIEPNDVDYIEKTEWKTNDRISIRNCHIKNCNRGVISYVVRDDFSFSNVEVLNCTFENNSVDNLYFDRCQNLIVENCKFDKHCVFSRSKNIVLKNSKSTSLTRFLDSTKEVSIENCEFDTYLSFEFTRGIFDNFMLLNNTFNNTYMSQGDGVLNNATIIGNKITARFNFNIKYSHIANNKFYPCESVNPSYLLYLSGEGLGHNMFINNDFYGSTVTSVTACFVATSNNLFLGNSIGNNISRNFVIQGSNNRGVYNRVPYGNVVNEGNFMDYGVSSKTPISPQIGQIYFDTDRQRNIVFGSEGNWLEYDGELAGMPRRGDWNNKMVPYKIGFQYFCTTKNGVVVNKPIYYNGDSWIEADGNPVGYIQVGEYKSAPQNVIAGTAYFSYDLTNPDSGTTGMMMFSNGNGVWLDGVGRIINDDYLNKYLKKGSTTERPTKAVAGHQYYDLSLNKPIWWTGTKWVDATGAEV